MVTSKAIGAWLATLCVLVIGNPAIRAQNSDFKRLFQALDSNKDGQIDSAEIQPEHLSLYARLVRTSDLDGNGQLNEKEFVTGLQPRRTAKPLTQKPESGLPGADSLKWLLIKMDTNGDQRLEEAEIPDRFYGVFERIESKLGGEEDGRIERRELVRAAPRLCQIAKRFTEQQGIDVQAELARLPEAQQMMMQELETPPRPMEALSNPEEVKHRFQEWDSNDDGQLTADEVPEPLKELYERLLKKQDGNGDGKISRQEILKFSRQLAKQKNRPISAAKVDKEVSRLLKRFDQDGDQLLSRSEVPPRMSNRFDPIDADGSGLLDRQEIEQVVKVLNRIRSAETSDTKGPKSQKRRKLGK